MRILLAILIGLISIANASSEVSLHINDTKTSHIRTIGFKNSGDIHRFSTQYQKDDDSYMIDSSLGVQKDIDSFDVFLDAGYDANSALDIEDRMMYTIGGGWTFYNDEFNKHKISYGLAYSLHGNDHGYVNKYRYKYEYNALLLSGKYVMWYMTPIEELTSEITLGLNLFVATLEYKHSYKRVKNAYDYVSSVGLKIKL